MQDFYNPKLKDEMRMCWTETKAAFADRLGVTRGRVSQWLAAGMPEREDGTLDPADALAWLLANLDTDKGRGTRERARVELGAVHIGRAAHAAVCSVLDEAGPAIAVAAAEAGLDRARAERVGDLAPLLMAQAVADQLRQAGLPEPELPAPDAWRARVVWGWLFDAAGLSAVTGYLAPHRGEYVGGAMAKAEAPRPR